MNEYYSASKEKPKAGEETDKKGVKKKKESSSHSKTDAEQKSSSKRRRAEAGDQPESIGSDGQMKTDDQKAPPPPVPETVPIAVEPIELPDASPVDDSGIGQNSEKEEFADARSEASTGQPDVPSPAVPEAKATDEVTNQQQKDDAFVDVEMDEGISTSSVAQQQEQVASALPAEAGVAVVDVDEQKVAKAAAEVVPAADSAITTGQTASRPSSDKMDAVEAVPSVAVAETTPAETPTGAATSPPIPAAAESVREMEKKRSPGPLQPLQPAQPVQEQAKQAAKEDEMGAECARRPANSNSEQQPPQQQQQQQQQRHSKILKQAELFNNLVMSHSRTDPAPKSTMTLERPKKVTIYGFKVPVLNEWRLRIERMNESAASPRRLSFHAISHPIGPCKQRHPARNALSLPSNLLSSFLFIFTLLISGQM